MRENPPFVPDQRLADPKYRRRLLNKIEALISVLEVARDKVMRNLGAPDADVRRLRRVLANLDGTLQVCRRARRSLVRPAAGRRMPRRPRPATNPDEMSFREYLELSNVSEYERLRSLGPISLKDVEATDLDDLLARLAAE